MDGKFISYIRVSTARQGASGLGLEAQQEAVRNYLNGGKWELLKEYREVESGRKSDRTELTKAMQHCKLTGAVLVVAKLDRLTRDTVFLSKLRESGVEFVCCDNPHANKLTIHILAGVAEYEAEQISARTKAALAAARARGVQLGGDRGFRQTAESAAHARAAATEQADAFAADVAPTIRRHQDNGMSLRQIAAALAAEGIKTARGGAWTAASVKNVLARA